MSANSKIQWTHHTGGPWLVCTEVSPGCVECYARDLLEARLAPIIRKAYRNAGFEDWETRPVWGKTAPRVLTKGFWKDALAFERKAKAAGARYRMFPSMIDWLDDMPAGIIDQDGKWLDRDVILATFLSFIRITPNLDWLLLTKRIEDWSERLHAAFRALNDDGDVWISQWLDGEAPPNVWLGVSVEDQIRADERIPILLQTPASIRFLSCEPLLGHLNIGVDNDNYSPYTEQSEIDWAIIGGESGPKARPCDVDWVVDLVRQCKSACVPVFVKQLGANIVSRNDAGFDGDPTDLWPMDTDFRELDSGYQGAPVRVLLHDKKGGDLNEWSRRLRVREFPKLNNQQKQTHETEKI